MKFAKLWFYLTSVSTSVWIMWWQFRKPCFCDIIHSDSGLHCETLSIVLPGVYPQWKRWSNGGGSIMQKKRTLMREKKKKRWIGRDKKRNLDKGTAENAVPSLIWVSRFKTDNISSRSVSNNTRLLINITVPFFFLFLSQHWDQIFYRVSTGVLTTAFVLDSNQAAGSNSVCAANNTTWKH